MYSSWDMVHNRQTDKWMDRQKKWQIEAGAPPKKLHTHREQNICWMYYLHSNIFTKNLVTPYYAVKPFEKS